MRAFGGGREQCTAGMYRSFFRRCSLYYQGGVETHVVGNKKKFNQEQTRRHENLAVFNSIRGGALPPHNYDRSALYPDRRPPEKPWALCGTSHTGGGFQDSPVKTGEDSALHRTMESLGCHEQSPKTRHSFLAQLDKEILILALSLWV
jgi:hypothetical protein